MSLKTFMIYCWNPKNLAKSKFQNYQINLRDFGWIVVDDLNDFSNWQIEEFLQPTQEYTLDWRRRICWRRKAKGKEIFSLWKMNGRGFSSTKAMFVLGENHFQKCFSVNVGVWLRIENKFFGNGFQWTVCWGVKWFLFLFYFQIPFSRKHRESWVRVK